MFKYFINIFLLFIVVDAFSQEQELDEATTSKDSIVYKSPYGIRLGVDISKPIKASVDGAYNSGFEIVGDYRVTKRLFIAAELGFEDETNAEEYTNSTAKGSYIRLGINYNAYENWLDMNNEVFMGFRYGFSIFDQTLNHYTPNVVNGEDNGVPYFPATLVTTDTTTNLNAHWTEFMFGFKVETFTNFYLGASFSYKVLISAKEPENFKTLYAPGFNRIFETGTGFGFNYTLSYLIPFSKK
ncbi:hypothetical protein BW723_11600 [Polaribacter reichenbachii]|uniref:Outer membrane protein beta-barrel domain-containing protein n=1 Tax=Polaribacter reichenbachii TaxID=996801 RepID=A0A1B8TPR1_9FLAO|nr:DUF6048 family protein [Polaribacter reichenbachii]APZ46887.1 hypothetical protein BW723_11600 [Polaribacter reichenbachii]AUC17530.1 hypothetical protein BTO17_02045 [Polaribacter reichenbachii]OBY61596.1 hypothetical protein LPB301_16175 [Polaribacter reichenbachii]